MLTHRKSVSELEREMLWEYNTAHEALDRMGVPKSRGNDVLTLWGRIVEAFEMQNLTIEQHLVGPYLVVPRAVVPVTSELEDTNNDKFNLSVFG